MSTSNSLHSRQTAVIFSLQNMQYIHWHLQATFKKGKIKMNLKGKKKKHLSFSAKMPAESGAQTRNRNRIETVSI